MWYERFLDNLLRHISKVYPKFSNHFEIINQIVHIDKDIKWRAYIILSDNLFLNQVGSTSDTYLCCACAQGADAILHLRVAQLSPVTDVTFIECNNSTTRRRIHPPCLLNNSHNGPKLCSSRLGKGGCSNDPKRFWYILLLRPNVGDFKTWLFCTSIGSPMTLW